MPRNRHLSRPSHTPQALRKACHSPGLMTGRRLGESFLAARGPKTWQRSECSQAIREEERTPKQSIPRATKTVGRRKTGWTSIFPPQGKTVDPPSLCCLLSPLQRNTSHLKTMQSLPCNVALPEKPHMVLEEDTRHSKAY